MRTHQASLPAFVSSAVIYGLVLLSCTRAAEESARHVIQMLRDLRDKNNVYMGTEEQALIEHYLQPDDLMLEWGSGFSTLWFSQFVKEYYSIEHNKEWFTDVQKKNFDKSHIHLNLVEVKKGYKGWRGGFEEGTEEQFKAYIDKVHELGVEKFDKVLIDGRARVPCALAIVKYLKPSSRVFIHDFFPRKRYLEVLNHYDIIASIRKTDMALARFGANGKQSIQSLVVLKLKKNPDMHS